METEPRPVDEIRERFEERPISRRDALAGLAVLSGGILFTLGVIMITWGSTRSSLSASFWFYRKWGLFAAGLGPFLVMVGLFSLLRVRITRRTYGPIGLAIAGLVLHALIYPTQPPAQPLPMGAFPIAPILYGLGLVALVAILARSIHTPVEPTEDDREPEPPHDDGTTDSVGQTDAYLGDLQAELADRIAHVERELAAMRILIEPLDGDDVWDESVDGYEPPLEGAEEDRPTSEDDTVSSPTRADERPSFGEESGRDRRPRPQHVGRDEKGRHRSDEEESTHRSRPDDKPVILFAREAVTIKVILLLLCFAIIFIIALFISV